jgi:hypothetical protein
LREKRKNPKRGMGDGQATAAVGEGRTRRAAVAWFVGGAARSVLAERESNGRRRREGQAVSSLGVAGLWGKRKRLVFGCGGRLL